MPSPTARTYEGGLDDVGDSLSRNDVSLHRIITMHPLLLSLAVE